MYVVLIKANVVLKYCLLILACLLPQKVYCVATVAVYRCVLKLSINGLSTFGSNIYALILCINFSSCISVLFLFSAIHFSFIPDFFLDTSTQSDTFTNTISSVINFSCLLITYIMLMYALYTGNHGPSNFTYILNVTSLPINLTCNVTGVVTWRINGTSYTSAHINESLSGHRLAGTNVLIDSPVNNTDYICVSTNNYSVLISNPAWIIIAGEYLHVTFLLLYRIYISLI